MKGILVGEAFFRFWCDNEGNFGVEPLEPHKGMTQDGRDDLLKYLREKGVFALAENVNDELVHLDNKIEKLSSIVPSDNEMLRRIASLETGLTDQVRTIFQRMWNEKREQKNSDMEQAFEDLEGVVDEVKSDISDIKEKIKKLSVDAAATSDCSEIRKELKEMEEKIDEKFHELDRDLNDMDDKFTDFKETLEQVEELTTVLPLLRAMQKAFKEVA